MTSSTNNCSTRSTASMKLASAVAAIAAVMAFNATAGGNGTREKSNRNYGTECLNAIIVIRQWVTATL